MCQTPLNQNDFKLPIIKDLGSYLPNPNCKQKVRFAIFECPICLKHYTTRVADVKGGKSSKCKSCSQAIRNRDNNPSKPKTTQQFIKDAIKIHDNKYDYSKCVYTTSTKPPGIICPTHGRLNTTANSHLQGCGCSKCYLNNVSNLLTKDTEYFVKKATTRHGVRYSYVKSNYINTKTPIIIICPIHGEFTQTPDIHIRGSHCPECSCKHYNSVPTTVYYVRVERDGIVNYKIGITTKTVAIRYRAEKSSVTPLWSYTFSTGKPAYHYEQRILKIYKTYKSTDNLLSSKGNSELFTKDILNKDIHDKQ